MKRAANFLLAAAFLTLFPVVSSAEPQLKLRGEIGAAAEASLARARSAPFDSLAWLRADLTGETASDADNKKEEIQFRPFKNYSGDISGRFIEIMSLNSAGSRDVHPALRQLLLDLPKYQRPDGYFCATGEIDWQGAIDRNAIGSSKKMLPALWGNARMLCGLVEANRAFPGDASLIATAKKLGDFYVGIVPRFTDPARMEEYTGGTSYASGYVTCWFPAMEGLVKLADLTGDKKYREAAIAIAAFYERLDKIPVDHTHGMLCNQVSLLLLYEATKQASYLERVEKRWEELVKGGYVNPAGGVLEKCRVENPRDEGCALSDWLRLNLELGRVTGKSRYWDMAERTLENHFLQNQTPEGGFGHRGVLCDADGAYGFGRSMREATWCCDFHGQIGFINLRSHLMERTPDMISCNMALDFTANDAAGTVTSAVSPGVKPGEVLRQRIRVTGKCASLRVRKPGWADGVAAFDNESGALLSMTSKDGFCGVANPGSGDVVFVYSGGVYAEDRRFTRLAQGPGTGMPVVLGFGPRLFACEGKGSITPVWPASVESLKGQGLVPFSSAQRGKEFTYVFSRPDRARDPKEPKQAEEIEEQLSRIKPEKKN